MVAPRSRVADCSCFVATSGGPLSADVNAVSSSHRRGTRVYTYNTARAAPRSTALSDGAVDFDSGTLTRCCLGEAGDFSTAYRICVQSTARTSDEKTDARCA